MKEHFCNQLNLFSNGVVATDEGPSRVTITGSVPQTPQNPHAEGCAIFNAALAAWAAGRPITFAYYCHGCGSQVSGTAAPLTSP